MKTRKLGKEMEVSTIGLGCLPMTYSYGPAITHEQANNIISAAVDGGITLFDTAECFGSPADPYANEVMVGEALKAYRDRVRIATKFGVSYSDDGVLQPDSRPETIRASLEGSLKRLNTDHIDIYIQHRSDPNTSIEELAQTMAELIKEGKILGWGLSETDANTVRRAHLMCPLTTVQNAYSLLAHKSDMMLPMLERMRIGFMAFAPLASGFLTGAFGPGHQFALDDLRRTMPQFSDEGHKANEGLYELLCDIASDKAITPTQAALAWIINKSKVCVPIPSTTNTEHLTEIVAAAEVNLTQEEMNAIQLRLRNDYMVYGGMEVRERFDYGWK